MCDDDGDEDSPFQGSEEEPEGLYLCGTLSAFKHAAHARSAPRGPPSKNGPSINRAFVRSSLYHTHKRNPILTLQQSLTLTQPFKVVRTQKNATTPPSQNVLTLLVIYIFLHTQRQYHSSPVGGSITPSSDSRITSIV